MRPRDHHNRWMTSVNVPATTIAATLTPSWTADPQASSQTPYAAATATCAAAGMVVTEMSTPTSAPDFDDVSESIPATPARKPTIHDVASGCQMKSSARSVSRSARLDRSHQSMSQVSSTVPTIPTGKPTTSASADLAASGARHCTSATQSAASGPNSGPTTIAPTMRIGWSRRTPMPAIIVAMIMNAR
jgi:hypothetical protein